ncbi:Protocadherin alpha-C2, partial [Schistosoma japonicum]
MLMDLQHYFQINLLFSIYQMILLFNVFLLKWIQTSSITIATNTHNNISNTSHDSIEYILNTIKYEELNRLPRYSSLLGHELLQVSHHCLVYDETPGQHSLLDEINGNTCQLLSNIQLVKSRSIDSILINVKIITTANPLAKYFYIDASNYSLLTSQHIDREELCNQMMTMTESLSSISDSLRTCCINRQKECVFPLNILVQIKFSREDTTATSNTGKSTNSISSTKPKNPTDKGINHGSPGTIPTGTADINSIADSSSSSMIGVTSNSRSKFFTINIKLIDINDNPPKFPNPQHTIHISEGIHIGSRLPLPLAEDLDCTEYNIVRYQLLTQGDDTFELIQLSNEFSDLPSLSSVLPSTSNQPIYAQFNNLPYSPHTENAFNYQPTLFTMNQLSSSSSYQQNRPEQLYLKVMKQLDWETKRSYHFILTAEDSGTPGFTGEMNLEIIVTDENDNHPIFRNKSLIVTVPENSPEGLHLIQLVADDPDEGKSGQIIYSLMYNDNSTLSYTNQLNNNTNDLKKRLFEIDTKTGWLIINGHLDYEKVKQHHLHILAHDQSGHPGFDEALVSIYVTDLNDVAPQITVESVNRISSIQSINDINYNKNNVLHVYINETPGYNIINYKLNEQYTDDSLLPTSQLLAFVVVNDPDTGPGGNFQCYLESTTINSNNNNNNNN